MTISNRIIFGLGLGSFIYLLTQLGEEPKTVLTIVTISVVSGILTKLFETEKISFLKALIIHYVSVSSLVIILAYINGWMGNRSLMDVLFYMSFLYFVSWCVVLIKNRIKTNELNKLLIKKLK